MRPPILNKFTTNLKNTLSRAADLALELRAKLIAPDHLLLALAEQRGGIAYEVLSKSDLRAGALRAYIEEHQDYASRIDDEGFNLADVKFSPLAKQALEKGVLIANKFQHKYVGTEHLLFGLLEIDDADFQQLLTENHIPANETKRHLEVVMKSTSKFPDLTGFFQPGTKELEKETVGGPRRGQGTPALDFFSHDLTDEKQQATIDPVVGRQDEIDRLVHILSRRTKNNPVLIGDPGVGKTAIVEGLAKKIMEGDVPEVLQGKRILALDLGLVVAGTMYRGEFESRLKQVIDEITASPDIILFIDELHTIIGAGSASGSMDAANLLKPALAKGQIRCIGATTYDEYRKHIESDPALERRFQPIAVDEPTVEETVSILKGLRPNYEQYHRVRISDEAIDAAATLSDRYVQDRFLPDKAIDLIDEAASKAKIRKKPVGAVQEIRGLKRAIEKLEEKKQHAVNEEQFERALAVKAESDLLSERLERLATKRAGAQQAISGSIGKQDVAEVVSRITGVPLSELVREERERLMHLEKRLATRIVGQEEAIKSLADSIRRSRVGLQNPNRPIGSFIFLGPSGVGKTETAKAIAELVFEDPEALIRIDMSEFGESFTVSKLIGAPAGYVGYKESGKLTEAVRRRPYSVVLFDEIEKAHPDVFNVLLQVLEDGHLTDATGKKINFKNTVIVLTSNIGLQNLNQVAALGFNADDDEEMQKVEERYEHVREAVLDDLSRQFRPEFLNRIDKTIVFKPLTLPEVEQIVDLELQALMHQLKREDLKLRVTRAARAHLAREGFNPDQGARALRRLIQETIGNPLAERLLAGKLKAKDTVRVTAKGGEIKIEKVGK
ncbi:MAG: ATP-dependent Clp protease ATP-binding subunit [Candidatus Kerfeldbacteria bacterium]|nr:ATP-dependent Clp protease ATP-binding subunit [Candidatus Kerfeldbacteria bacterium]